LAACDHTYGILGRALADRHEGLRIMTTYRENAPQPAAVFSTAAVTLVGTLCVLYIVSQFFRNTIAVIAPDLAAELHLSPVEIGLLASAFFFAFAAAQVPLGVALDRFGPKRCLLVCVAILVAGTVVFSTAATVNGLIGGRILIGLGAASFLVAPLTLYARWFAPERFSTLAGIHLGIGTLGTLCATAPLAFAVAAIGWRATFLAVGMFTIGMGALVLVLVRDDPPGVRAESRRETVRESLAGIVEAIHTPSIGRLFLVLMSSYSSLILILGLWGGPYLTHIYGYDLQGRGDILLIPALTQIVGSFIWGPMDRVFGGYKLPVLMGHGLTASALLILAAFGELSIATLVSVLALLGFSSAMTPVLKGHGKSVFEPHLIGRGITLMNIGTMGGVFLSQTVSGAVIAMFPADGGIYPLDAYRAVFGLQAVFALVAFVAYLGAKDPSRTPAG
jgi:MFS family permease